METATSKPTKPPKSPAKPAKSPAKSRADVKHLKQDKKAEEKMRKDIKNVKKNKRIKTQKKKKAAAATLSSSSSSPSSSAAATTAPPPSPRTPATIAFEDFSHELTAVEAEQLFSVSVPITCDSVPSRPADFALFGFMKQTLLMEDKILDKHKQLIQDVFSFITFTSHNTDLTPKSLVHTYLKSGEAASNIFVARAQEIFLTTLHMTGCVQLVQSRKNKLGRHVWNQKMCGCLEYLGNSLALELSLHPEIIRTNRELYTICHHLFQGRHSDTADLAIDGMVGVAYIPKNMTLSIACPNIASLEVHYAEQEENNKKKSLAELSAEEDKNDMEDEEDKASKIRKKTLTMETKTRHQHTADRIRTIIHQKSSGTQAHGPFQPRPAHPDLAKLIANPLAVLYCERSDEQAGMTPEQIETPEYKAKCKARELTVFERASNYQLADLTAGIQTMYCVQGDEFSKSVDSQGNPYVVTGSALYAYPLAFMTQPSMLLADKRFMNPRFVRDQHKRSSTAATLIDEEEDDDEKTEKKKRSSASKSDSAMKRGMHSVGVHCKENLLWKGNSASTTSSDKADAEKWDSESYAYVNAYIFSLTCFQEHPEKFNSIVAPIFDRIYGDEFSINIKWVYERFFHCMKIKLPNRFVVLKEMTLSLKAGEVLYINDRCLQGMREHKCVEENDCSGFQLFLNMQFQKMSSAEGVMEIVKHLRDQRTVDCQEGNTPPRARTMWDLCRKTIWDESENSERVRMVSTAANILEKTNQGNSVNNRYKKQATDVKKPRSKGEEMFRWIREMEERGVDNVKPTSVTPKEVTKENASERVFFSSLIEEARKMKSKVVQERPLIMHRWMNARVDTCDQKAAFLYDVVRKSPYGYDCLERDLSEKERAKRVKRVEALITEAKKCLQEEYKTGLMSEVSASLSLSTGEFYFMPWLQ